MVMPALIGGFGRLFKQFNYLYTITPIQPELKLGGKGDPTSYPTKRKEERGRGEEEINNNIHISNEDSRKQGPYMAGLIEGDGTIVVPDVNKKNAHACIRICFHSNDMPFVKFLISRIGHGRINNPKKGNYIQQEISTYAGLYYMADQINGYFRTPKQEALNRLIDWLNAKSLKYLDKGALKKNNKLDLSPIENNSWLAGKIDADGNFNIIIGPRKNTNNIRIQAQFRLELRQFYHRSTLNKLVSTSYLDIMSYIANYQGVNVYNRARIQENSITYQYFFVAGSIKSQKLIRKYLEVYPQMSTKYNDYKDWCRIIDKKPRDITKSKQIKTEKISKANIIKSGMNSKRTIFSFKHLFPPLQ